MAMAMPVRTDRHPPSSSVPARPDCHPHASLDRHLANAAILDCLGRLLLVLVLVLPLLVLPLLHLCMMLLPLPLLLPLLLLPLSLPSHPPLQGQRTHTSCKMTVE